MSEKLKTLKDIEGVEEYDAFDRTDTVEREVLRQEAIKWIKEEISIHLKSCHEPENQENILWVMKDEDIQRWMKRLDITEEDLK